MPITTQSIEELVTTGTLPRVAAPFGLARFDDVKEGEQRVMETTP